ncbi:MAG: hypothetical protein ACOX8W_06320 [bacterium]|jgi:hypothetical protein
MDNVQAMLRRYRKDLMNLDNVVGIGKGYKDKGGETTDEMAAVILVAKKKTEKELLRSQIIPKTLGAVPTDVIEVGEVRLLADPPRKGKSRPALPGTSIGHYLITAGTFGAVVRDRRTGEKLILSNNHVLANATDGSDRRARVGDLILQPGKYDGGVSDDGIARLHRFIPIQRPQSASGCIVRRLAANLAKRLNLKAFPGYGRFGRSKEVTNLIDAAVAKPLSPDLIASPIVGIGEVSEIAEPRIGLRVMKSGRTTGMTTSSVRTLDVSLKVTLDDYGDYAMFDDQILMGHMSEGGDSGSLIVDENHRAIGLLFAGSDKITLANRITNVFDLLDIEF